MVRRWREDLAAPMPLALLVGAIAVGGSIALRCSVGSWFACPASTLAMLTLAFAQIVWAVATQWAWLTGGDDGIAGRVAARGRCRSSGGCWC